MTLYQLAATGPGSLFGEEAAPQTLRSRVVFRTREAALAYSDMFRAKCIGAGVTDLKSVAKFTVIELETTDGTTPEWPVLSVADVDALIADGRRVDRMVLERSQRAESQPFRCAGCPDNCRRCPHGCTTAHSCGVCNPPLNDSCASMEPVR